MKIGLLIIATNKYTQFLQKLISSADKYFLHGEDVTYFIFTNHNINIETERKVIKIDVEHKPWPYMTLFRYKIFDTNAACFENMDYLYFQEEEGMII